MYVHVRSCISMPDGDYKGTYATTRIVRALPFVCHQVACLISNVSPSVLLGRVIVIPENYYIRIVSPRRFGDQFSSAFMISMQEIVAGTTAVADYALSTIRAPLGSLMGSQQQQKVLHTPLPIHILYISLQRKLYFHTLYR